MDLQDHTLHTSHSGVHLCNRCGWPFPNPHPSAKHRRAHKKICGTIEGYTNLIGSEVVSDDEHHPNDDKEKTPSPKIDKKTSIDSDGGDGEIRKSLSRSEDEVFADAVTEFADGGTGSGSANKTLDRDLFFSFKDAENAGTNEVLNDPIEVSEKTDSHMDKTEETEIKNVGDSSESNPELTRTGGLVKDGGVGPKPEEAKSIDVMEAGDEKGQESQTSEPITEEAKDSEVTKTTPEVSEPVKESETVEEIKVEKIELDHKHVPEVAKESEIDQTISVLDEKVDLGAPNEQIQEVVKEPVAVLTEKLDLEAPEQIQESVTVLIEEKVLDAPELEKSSDEQIQEVVKEPVVGLTEKRDLEAPDFGKSSIEQIQEAVEESVAKEPDTVVAEKEDLGGPHLEKQSIEADSILSEKDLGTPELEGSSREQIQEVAKEPDTVVAEKEDLGGPHLEKQSNEPTREVVEKTDSILTEKQDLGAPELEVSSREQIQEVVKEPDTVMAEKEDLGGPHLGKQSNETTHEVVEKTDSILTEKQDLDARESEKCIKENIVVEPDSVLTEKEDLGGHESEKCSKDEVIEQIVNNGNLVADVSTETITIDSKNASGVVPEPIVEEGNGKLTNNHDSGADLAVDSSSVNSLEGTWGSVSVLSTASIDAETLQLTEKSKVNSGKSNTGTSDVYEPPSFMTLVEPESKDNKSGSSDVQDSHPLPNSEASQAGWFPTLTNINNESEGRKRNEEAMAKVTNWSTGKQSTPLKNLLGEARSPSGKQPEPVVQKDEAPVNPPVNDDVSSPPKLIEDGKNGRKKVKGRSSWVPFVCCSSVNVK